MEVTLGVDSLMGIVEGQLRTILLSSLKYIIFTITIYTAVNCH